MTIIEFSVGARHYSKHFRSIYAIYGAGVLVILVGISDCLSLSKGAVLFQNACLIPPQLLVSEWAGALFALS